jgi:hypothetical protein
MAEFALDALNELRDRLGADKVSTSPSHKQQKP